MERVRPATMEPSANIAGLPLMIGNSVVKPPLMPKNCVSTHPCAGQVKSRMHIRADGNQWCGRI